MPTETNRHHSATGVASYNAEFPDTLGDRSRLLQKQKRFLFR